jgi:hypothetical protein
MCSHLDIDLVVLLLSILMLVQFDRETLNNEAFSGLECFVGRKSKKILMSHETVSHSFKKLYFLIFG